MQALRGSDGTGWLTIQSKSLAIIVALVAGQEILEVVVGVLDRSDFVIHVNEVAAWSQ